MVTVSIRNRLTLQSLLALGSVAALTALMLPFRHSLEKAHVALLYLILVLVAGGLLSSAVHEFAEAGVVTFAQSPAVDLTWLIRPGTVAASLATGMLGLQPVPTQAEVVVWLLYVIPMSLYVLWPHRPRVPAAQAATT